MYHAVVRRKVRSVFARLGEGDYRPMIDSLADLVENRATQLLIEA